MTRRLLPFERDQTALSTNEVLENLQKEIRNHSVSLLYGSHPHGSGTLIEWDGEFGILTAGHVAKAIDFTSPKRLQIPLLGASHDFGFSGCILRTAFLRHRKSNPMSGPDLAVIRLPSCSALDLLKIKKSFLNITSKTETKLEKALGNTGLFFLWGAPAEFSSLSVKPHHGFASSRLMPSGCFQVIWKRKYDKDGFDYLEVEADCQGVLGVQSLKGVSGGGLWRLMIGKRKHEEKHNYKGVAFAGVAFYQQEDKDGKRMVNCHGGISVFKKLAGSLTR